MTMEYNKQKIWGKYSDIYSCLVDNDRVVLRII